MAQAAPKPGAVAERGQHGASRSSPVWGGLGRGSAGAQLSRRVGAVVLSACIAHAAVPCLQHHLTNSCWLAPGLCVVSGHCAPLNAACQTGWPPDPVLPLPLKRSTLNFATNWPEALPGSGKYCDHVSECSATQLTVRDNVTPLLQAMLAVITRACRQINREYATYGLHTDPKWLAMVDGAQLRQARHRLHGAAAASLEGSVAEPRAINLTGLRTALSLIRVCVD